MLNTEVLAKQAQNQTAAVYEIANVRTNLYRTKAVEIFSYEHD